LGSSDLKDKMNKEFQETEFGPDEEDLEAFLDDLD